MGIQKIKKKSLIEDRKRDLDLINQFTIKPLTEEEVYTFSIKLCDNDVDRVGDKMSDNFLNEVAENIVGLTGLKDHDWSSDNQTARLYDAKVVEDDTKKTALGENKKYVLGKAYTLTKYKDYIDKINAGLLKETSVSFESSEDTCSICGESMIKDDSDIAKCCNGHVAGQYYDNKLCYNNINKLKDILEWSLVAVPCQRDAGIKNKSLGGSVMKKAEFLIRQFMSSKAYQKADDNDKETLEKALVDEENTELTDEEINELIAENSKLKDKIKELEMKVKDTEAGRTRDKIEAIVDKEFDGAGLITPEIKELLKKEIPYDDLKLEDGQIPGLADVFTGLKEKYKGLFVEEQKDDADGTEEKVEVEEEVEEKAETIDNVEVKSKSYNKPSGGITFGATQKSYNKDIVKENKKPGIYF